MILTHIFTDRISFNNINDTCNYFHSSFCGIFYIFSHSYSWIYHSLDAWIVFTCRIACSNDWWWCHTLGNLFKVINWVSAHASYFIVQAKSDKDLHS